jgi:hypothetical protein
MKGIRPLLVFLSSYTQLCQAFLTPAAPGSTARTRLYASTSRVKTTLTDETTWMIRMFLGSLKTTQGNRVEDELIALPVKFIEEQGYEPPQGQVQIVTKSTSSGDNIPTNNRWKFTKTYWKLSEDPNERKDGLWVWGLFQEPLYPYLLLQLETSAVDLRKSSDDEPTKADSDQTADSIAPMQLYAQINHKRDDNGVNIEGSYPLKVRRLETVKADPFGAATVDIYEDVQIGTIRIEAMEQR